MEWYRALAQGSRAPNGRGSEKGADLFNLDHLWWKNPFSDGAHPQRLGGGPRPKRLIQEQGSAANQAAIRDVEDRPLEVALNVEMQEIPNAEEDDPVVKVAERAGQDQAEGGAERLVAGRGTAQAPVGDGDR